MRNGKDWTQWAYLKPAAVGDSQGDDEFGGAVAISGGTVIIGARGESSNTTGVNNAPNESDAYAGAAYVFNLFSAPSISFITGLNPFQFQFDGAGHSAFQVEASTNLIDWVPVGTPTNISNNLFQFGDAGTTNSPRRFYRLKVP